MVSSGAVPFAGRVPRSGSPKAAASAFRGRWGVACRGTKGLCAACTDSSHGDPGASCRLRRPAMTHSIFSPEGLFLLSSRTCSASPASRSARPSRSKHTAKVSEAHGDLSLNGAGDPRARPRPRPHRAYWGNHGLATLALPASGSATSSPGGTSPTRSPPPRRATASSPSARRRRSTVQALDGRLAPGRARDRAPGEGRARPRRPQRRAAGERPLAVRAARHARRTLHRPRARRRLRGSHRRRRRLRRGVVGAAAGVHCSAEVTLAAVGDASWVFVRDAREDVVRALVVARDGAVRSSASRASARPRSTRRRSSRSPTATPCSRARTPTAASGATTSAPTTTTPPRSPRRRLPQRPAARADAAPRRRSPRGGRRGLRPVAPGAVVDLARG
jgi:hypothetical protein